MNPKINSVRVANQQRGIGVFSLILASLSVFTMMFESAQARTPSQLSVVPTPTATLRPIPKFLIRGVTASSPKVDGKIGGKQVTLKADLPVGNQPGVQVFVDLFKFQLKEDELNDGSRAIFIIRDGNGAEVYHHVEKNLPFCAFGDSNKHCNSLSVRDGVLAWPDSDGHASQPIQPGRYFLQARIEDNNGNVICRTREDFAFEVSIGFDTPPAPPQQLPPLAGSAEITQPANNAALKGIVNIMGTATLNNFDYYKFEFEDARCNLGVCFVADARKQVRRGLLMKWDTRTVPNGVYLLHMVVVDKFGRVLSTTPRINITIQN